MKSTWLAIGLISAVIAPAALAAPDAPDLQYHVTVSSHGAVMFEGEGRTGAERPLELRQFVLSQDNAGHGESFVDSGVKVVLRPLQRDAAHVSAQLALDVVGMPRAAQATVEARLGDAASAELAGYTVTLVATALPSRTSPPVPEDFAYLAPSLDMASLVLPHVRFDRASYQVANAQLQRADGERFAAVLVAPKTVARAGDFAAPLLYTAER